MLFVCSHTLRILNFPGFLPFVLLCSLDFSPPTLLTTFAPQFFRAFSPCGSVLCLLSAVAGSSFLFAPPSSPFFTGGKSFPIFSGSFFFSDSRLRFLKCFCLRPKGTYIFFFTPSPASFNTLQRPPPHSTIYNPLFSALLVASGVRWLAGNAGWLLHFGFAFVTVVTSQKLCADSILCVSITQQLPSQAAMSLSFAPQALG